MLVTLALNSPEPKNRFPKNATQCSGRVRTRTARSGVEDTGHEATAPPPGVSWSVDNAILETSTSEQKY